MVQNVRSISKPFGWSLFDSWNNTVDLLPEWCNAAGQCYQQVLLYREFVSFAVISDTDGGAYVLAKRNSTKTCDAFISSECAKAKGAEKCIRDAMEEQMAQEWARERAAAVALNNATVPGDGGSSGDDTNLAVAIAVPVCIGSKCRGQGGIRMCVYCISVYGLVSFFACMVIVS